MAGICYIHILTCDMLAVFGSVRLAYDMNHIIHVANRYEMGSNSGVIIISNSPIGEALMINPTTSTDTVGGVLFTVTLLMPTIVLTLCLSSALLLAY